MAATPDNSSSSPSVQPSSILSRRRKSSIIMPVLHGATLSSHTSTVHIGCLFRANDPWRTRWDLLIILLALYNSVSVPLEVGFELEESYLGLKVVGYLLDSFFAMDIVINFRTAYYNGEGKEETRPRAIAWAYMASGRFFADLLATFPFEILANIIGGFVPVGKLKLIKLLKLVRLIRLRRIITYLHTTHSFKVAMRGITILYILFLYVHMSGCLWVGLTQSEYWFPTKDMHNETKYYSNQFSQYVTCLYYGTLLLLGADILPVTVSQVVYSTVFLLVAAILTALIYGHMMVLLDTLAEQRDRRAGEIDASLKSLSSIGVSRELQSQVQVYLTGSYDFRRKQEELQNLLDALSPSLRFQISIYLFEPALNHCLRLKGGSKMTEIVAGRLSTHVSKPETTLVRIGDKSDDLFLISAGEYTVCTLDKEAEEAETGHLSPGDYFGEVGLIMEGQRSATVASASFGTYATLPKEDVLDVFQMTPSVLVHLTSHIHSTYHDPWKQHILLALQQVPCLCQCSDEQLDRLYYRMEMMTLASDTVLVEAESLIEGLYVVGKGCLGVIFDNAVQRLSVIGLTTGSVCFASSLLYSLPSRLQLVAQEKSIVMTLSREALEGLVKKHADLRRPIEAFKLAEKQAKPLFADFIRGSGFLPPREKLHLGIINAIKQGQVLRKLHPSSTDLVKALDEFLQLRAASASSFRGLPQCVKLLTWALRSTQTAGERLSRVSELTEGTTY